MSPFGSHVTLGACGLRNPGRGCNSSEDVLLTEGVQGNCNSPDFANLTVRAPFWPLKHPLVHHETMG